jgi:hypothetical protein
LDRYRYTRIETSWAFTNPRAPRSELAVIWALRNISALFSLGQLTRLIAGRHATFSFSQDVSNLASFWVFNDILAINGVVEVTVTRAR